jgi:hypothetical protein
MAGRDDWMDAGLAKVPAGPVANGRATAGRAAETSDPDIPSPEPWPGPPAEDVYHGLAGEITRAIGPQTEADPLAVLAQLLVMFGSAIGRTAYWVVEGDRHFGNLYCCLVGQTSTGRKGTSKGRALQAFAKLDDGWTARLTSGLSSGEGLLYAVRDELRQKQPVKSKGRVVDYQSVIVDEGVADKRLLVVEPEFGRVLRVMEREGNTLSARLREGWDTGDMSNLTKQGLRATGAHLSVVGHVTPQELRRLLTDVDAANGLANRFLWLAVRRSKLLPLGGEPVELSTRAHKLALAVEAAKKCREVGLDAEARALWCDRAYRRLSGGRVGVWGVVTNRAVAQVRRLAMLYALLDFRAVVGLAHLKAALALWDYCERSARWVFGGGTGDPDADQLLAALVKAGEGGLTGRDVSAVFSRHKSAADLRKLLSLLLDQGLVVEEQEPTAGRPRQRWKAAESANKAQKANEAAGQGFTSTPPTP